MTMLAIALGAWLGLSWDEWPCWRRWTITPVVVVGYCALVLWTR
jgi:hypothetical protein